VHTGRKWKSENMTYQDFMNILNIIEYAYRAEETQIVIDELKRKEMQSLADKESIRNLFILLGSIILMLWIFISSIF